MAGFKHELLLKLRESKAWSRREMMLKLHDAGVDTTEETLASWEKGETVPDADKLGPISRVLGVQIDTLVR